jgi:hypothetical protein
MKRKRGFKKDKGLYKFTTQPQVAHFFVEDQQIIHQVTRVLSLPRVLVDMVCAYATDGFGVCLAALAAVVEKKLRSKDFYYGRTLYRVPKESLNEPLYLELTVSQCSLRKPILYVVVASNKEFARGDVCMTFASLSDSKFLRGKQSAAQRQRQEWTDLGLRGGNICTELDWEPSLTRLPYRSKFMASNLREWILHDLNADGQVLACQFAAFKTLSMSQIQHLLASKK